MAQIVTFDNSPDVPSFVVSDDKIEELRFEYQPSTRGLWKDIKIDGFEVILLQNPYLNLESNIFEVRFDNIEETCGWIFPISVLESTETEMRGSLLNYVFASYMHLLSNIANLERDKNTITQYYSEGIIILAIHKKTVGHEFDICQYLFSLYRYGYSKCKEDVKPNSIKSYDKRSELTETKRLKIKQSKININTHKFIRILIEEQLSMCSDIMVRFVLLYQVIEFLISLEHDALFKKALHDYEGKIISKNDFIEEIRDISNEKRRISNIVAKSSIPQPIKDGFISECKSLFNDVGYQPKDTENVHSMLYSFRNQLTHSYRNYIDKEANLAKTIGCFEVLIMEVLVSYDIEK